MSPRFCQTVSAGFYFWKEQNMSALCKQTIFKLIQEEKLFTDYVNLEDQLQPNGFDLTIKEVGKLAGAGVIGTDNKERILSEILPVDFDQDGFAHLSQGVYAIVVNEIVTLPKNLMALVRPRSSLLRCGATIGAAVWDAGYSGRSQMTLRVDNTLGLKIRKDARIAQMVFFTLDEAAAVGYSGRYQNENK